MSNELDEALSDPLKRSKRSGNILARLFWKAVHFYDIGYKEWNLLMRRYTTNVYNVPEQTVARRGEAKNNLTSALLNHTPTFMQFLRGMKLLDIRKVEFTVKLYRGDDMEELTLEESVTFPNNSSGEFENGNTSVPAKD